MTTSIIVMIENDYDENNIAFTQIINESTVPSVDDSANRGMNDGFRKVENCWGLLRKKGFVSTIASTRDDEEIKLLHRIDDSNKRDTYTIGRSAKCDVVVNDQRVSKCHCSIYLDYSGPTAKVYIEDTSGERLMQPMNVDY